jgi:hypothetical protein
MAKDKIKNKPDFNNVPPAQEKYARGDDDWNLLTTACPIDSPKVTSGRVNSAAMGTLTGNYMRPVYSDKESAYIRESTSNGKKE